MRTRLISTLAQRAGTGTADAGATRIAAVQMASGPRVEANLKEAARLIDIAAAQGARLVALPEYFGIMGMKDTDKVAVREAFGADADLSWVEQTERLGTGQTAVRRRPLVYSSFLPPSPCRRKNCVGLPASWPTAKFTLQQPSCAALSPPAFTLAPQAKNLAPRHTPGAFRTPSAAYRTTPHQHRSAVITGDLARQKSRQSPPGTGSSVSPR